MANVTASVDACMTKHVEWALSRARYLQLVSVSNAVSDEEAELLSERIITLEELLASEIPDSLPELRAQLGFAVDIVREHYQDPPLLRLLIAASAGVERMVAG